MKSMQIVVRPLTRLGARLASATNWSGPYMSICHLLVVGLIVLSTSRLLLVAWQWDRVNAAGIAGAALLQGVRADLILLGYLSIIPVMLAPLLARARTAKAWFGFTRVWTVTALLFVVFMELASPQFIMQYDVRPNRLFVEYLAYPAEVLSTLWNGFRIAVILGIACTILLSVAIGVVLKSASARAVLWSNKKLLLTWPVIVLVLAFQIRSTTGHRPANPALFALSGDAMVNSLVINSGWSVLDAVYSLRKEAKSSEIYGKLPTKIVFDEVKSAPWLREAVFSSAQIPTLHQQIPAFKRNRPLNLVIVLEESLGATFVESLGGVAVTPELEKLKHDGWWFEQLYATGTRSVRGIEAVVAGFAPTPARSVVKLSLAQQNFYTLALGLKQQGYRTEFVYGGEAHFDNMRSFFTGNGFENVVDLAQMQPKFVGSWGASDEDLFDKALERLSVLHGQNRPFFSLIFSSSNHEPFEFPDGKIKLHEEPKNTVNNAVKYADHALGKFIKEARKQPYWRDTLFLIVADHDNRVYGNSLVPIKKFHIPGLILGADVTPRRITTVASQIDLAPTLLSIMGVSSAHPMIGRDFATDSVSPGRAMLQFENYFAWLEDGTVTILRPGQPPLLGAYTALTGELKLSSDRPTPPKIARAMAHVLAPSILYREQKYRLPKPTD